MHFYLYIWLAVTVEVIEWRMFVLSFVRSLDCQETAYYVQPNSTQTEKPQLDTNVLADEIEKYLWKCFLYRCCWNMKAEQFYDATLISWVASLSCLPCARAVILRVSVDQWMLGLNFCLFFLLMKLSIKKSTKSRHFLILVELSFLWLLCCLLKKLINVISGL